MVTGDLSLLHNFALVIRINNHILAFLLPRFSDNKCANPSQEDPLSSSTHLLHLQVSPSWLDLSIQALHCSSNSPSLSWTMAHITAHTLKLK